MNGERSWKCTYDACGSDADCAGGAVCECEVGFAKQHVCLTNGNCRVDSDCPTGERCMLSMPDLLTLSRMSGRAIEKGDEVVPPHSTSSYHEALGYFCTTPNDTCDGDCVGGIGRCTYDMNKKRWVWGYQF